MLTQCLVAKTCNFISFADSRYRISIDTTVVDHHPDSLHNDIVKPRNKGINLGFPFLDCIIILTKILTLIPISNPNLNPNLILKVHVQISEIWHISTVYYILGRNVIFFVLKVFLAV